MPVVVAGVMVAIATVVGVVITLGGQEEPAADVPSPITLSAPKTGDGLATPAGHTQENASYWGRMEE